MLYSDEDKLEPDGNHADPFFKPDWSPEFLLSCMYTCHLGVYRTALVRELGGFRSEFDTAQDYDLVLRIMARTDRIKHIPDVLYHWRKTPLSTATGYAGKPRAHQVAHKALESYLAATGQKGTVEPGPFTGLHRVRVAVVGRPRVSIVIPSACQPVRNQQDGTYYITRCVESIRRKTRYARYEITVIHNGDMDPAVARRLARLKVVPVCYREPAFNLSAKMNLGAASAGGEHLLFLNDDMEVISPAWLESMLEFSQQPQIGAVGAKLFYPDGRLQHVGVVLYNGDPGHCFYQHPGDSLGYFCGNIVNRNYSAITGACLMTRADVFRAVGGFDEAFPLNYNDIDYCLRVRARGLRIVYTPYAQLYHFESASKAGTFQHEREAFAGRWGANWGPDPYYNPNLTQQDVDYRIEVGDGAGTETDQQPHVV
jgi:GT2 family glycosyltransferase